MTRFMWTLVLLLSLAGPFRVQAAPPAGGETPSGKFTPAQVEFFTKEIQPLLKENCLKCHRGSRAKAGLRLDYRGGLLKGGESGPAVDLKQPDKGLLLEALRYEGYEMPPSGKLPEAQIALITKWIAEGLPWSPGGDQPPVDEEEQGHVSPTVNEETRRHWAFQPLTRPAVPEVEAPADFVRNPIDAFVLAKLRAAGLEPSPRADGSALLRRAAYNLTGLPPTAEMRARFAADNSPEAFGELVEELLGSPHYGEQWARHWLDLVRYAETNSYERDGAKPFIWRYRDYVIRAFNDDKPYDQFVREQLAGDELEEPTVDSVTATGYYRLGIWDDEPVSQKQALFDDLDDIVSTTGQVFLGLTIGCARCHEHKLDPMPQADYYRMLAFFRNIRRYGVRSHPSVVEASVRMVGAPDELRRYEQDLATWKADLKSTEDQLRKLEAPIRELLKGGERDDFKDEAARLDIIRKHVPQDVSEADARRYEELAKRRDALRKSEPEGLTQVLCVKEHGSQPQPTHVLIRGNAEAAGKQVAPGFPEVLGVADPQEFPVPAGGASSGRRRVLAEWIASPGNPLTARVIVNRIWQYHFGRGLVATSSDFGLQGERPTHPALLDWLASELIAGGWKLKPIHRLIMASNTYQMSSRSRSVASDKDPQNELLWRFAMRRLTAEEIRDTILAVNGRLNNRVYGPSFYAKIPAAVLAGQSRPGSGWGDSSPEERGRRSLYIHVKRSLLTPVLTSFDFPEPDLTCPVRFNSTQPTQALGMLNSEFLNEQARHFAELLRAQHPDDEAAQVRTALSRAVQRPIRGDEVERGLALLDRLRAAHGADQPTALQHFCLMTLNLNEMIYLD